MQQQRIPQQFEQRQVLALTGVSRDDFNRWTAGDTPVIPAPHREHGKGTRQRFDLRALVAFVIGAAFRELGIPAPILKANLKMLIRSPSGLVKLQTDPEQAWVLWGSLLEGDETPAIWHVTTLEAIAAELGHPGFDGGIALDLKALVRDLERAIRQGDRTVSVRVARVRHNARVRWTTVEQLAARG